MKSVALLAILLATGCSANAQQFDPRDPRSPLHLIRVIELPDVKGRIDHVAPNGDATHLYIAENGNDTVDDVDLTTGKVVGRITGVHEPQGIAWLAAENEIAVTSGDGLVTFYRTSDLQKVAAINLGTDADNVRIDRRNGHLVVGYGAGGLAVIDAATHRVISQILLPAHPEAFEIVGTRVFVNVPDAHKIVIANIDRASVISTIGTRLRFANFPMASEPNGSRIAVAYRTPTTVSVLDTDSAAEIFSAATCGDADDLYFRQSGLIVVCGSGAVELIGGGDQHVRVDVATQKGARTGLLDLTRDHLFVAVPARAGAAAVWEMSFVDLPRSGLWQLSTHSCH